jgi:hypothetical protein
LRKVYTKFHYVFAMIVVVLMENIMCRWVYGEICIFVFKQFAGTDWKVVLSGTNHLKRQHESTNFFITYPRGI